MSIFGKTRTTSAEVTVESYTGHVEDTLAGIQTIVSESAKESFQLNAGMYISDVMMEESVLEGAQPEVLLEAFAKGTFDRIKSMFEGLWAKVKAWFGKVKQNLLMMFSSGEKFVKEFKDPIRAKSAKGYTYNGFVFDLAKGDAAVASKRSILEKGLEESVGFDINNVTLDAQKEAIEKAKHKESYNASEEKEALVKKLGEDSIGEVLKELALVYRNGEESKEEIEDFAGNSKEQLIGFIESGKKQVSEIEKAQKNMDAQFQRVFAAINKAKAKIEGGKAEDEKASQAKGKAVAFATHKFNMAHYALSLQMQLSGVQVEATKAAARQAESALKGFLRFKPAKEGMTSQQSQFTDSILESAMRHV